MLYLFPFLDRVVVELRRYTGPAAEAPAPASHWLWRFRNRIWGSAAPGFGYLIERHVGPPRLRYGIVNSFNRILGVTTERVLKSAHTSPTDQMIRYPDASSWKRYTFSIWAFPEERYAEVLREYFAWAREYYRKRGWRVNLLHVGYRILQDQQGLFSYTYDGTVLTIDPVSTGAPGWREFLDAYNEFCSSHGGSPLPNQSWGLRAEHLRRAFGDRVDRFEEIRQRLDPDGRLLNGYFRELLEAPAPARR
jgi:FAD/FMN-containing dehydrogenase